MIITARQQKSYCPLHLQGCVSVLSLANYHRSQCPALFSGATGQRKVYWQNLREEPLVFINGNPFVVRESDNPFANLEYTGGCAEMGVYSSLHATLGNLVLHIDSKQIAMAEHTVGEG